MIRSAVDGAHIQRADAFRRRQGRSFARLFVAAMAIVLVFAGSSIRSVLASGDPPVATSQNETTREAKPVDVFLNVFDNEFDELTFEVVDPPANGTLDPAECDGGFCTYTPATGPNFIGTDDFTWRANDGTADSTLATVTIDVTANIAPQAFDQSEVVRQDTPEFISLLAFDDDLDDLTYAVVSGPTHGTLDACVSGTCTYTPDAAFIGADSFTWKVNDGLADSNTATFTIDVAANSAPVASDGSFFAFTNTATPVNLTASDTEGDFLTYAVVTVPAHGDLTDCSSGSCTYTPDAGFVGPDTFTWKASDGLLDSNVATTSVTVGEPLGRVLILDPTVTSGAESREAQAAAVQGYAADVVNEATWSSMTTTQFDTYAALILGDPTCGSVDAIAAAEANRSTWSPVVDGNVVVIGTDPIFHEDQGGGQLTDSAMAYVLAATGTTSLYVTLSCYYDGAEDNTPVPVLDAFGTFEVGHADCFNDAHIVAEHPALAGLDDGDLSGWSCSVHEVFQDWPLNFVVLAIAENFGSVYTAPDGTVGSPYILAAGDITVTSDIDLAPLSATNPIGSSHELTATVSNESGPIVGTTVTFSVIDGPHSGVTGTDVTDAAGTATFSYLGTTTGTDTIKATFVDGEERTQTSNLVTKTWVTTPTFLLSVSRDGAGSGSVSSSPAGIDCGSDCSQAYDAGTLVTLTAVAATGSDFTGWTGEGCSGTGTCQVTMDAARSVTATFGLEPTPTADLSVTQTDSPDPVTSGNAVQYFLTVTNSGPDAATGVVLMDTLPAGATLVAADSPGCVSASGVVTCTIGPLGSGASVNISIVVMAPTIATLTTMTNAATVSGNEGDPSLANNTSSEVTTVQPANTNPDIASGWITAAGGTVATNAGKPPTKKDPMTTAVTVPPGFPGMVTIAEGPITTCPTGVVCFGQRAEITAPTTTASQPLRLAFSYHPGSLPPGTQLHEITMFHDGVEVPRCADGSGIASPDPCISSVVRGKGAVTVVVLSSENGSWIGGR